MTSIPQNAVTIASLAPVQKGGDWALSLLHSAPQPRVVWITQGQARVIIGPRLYGVGVHTFLFLPAHQPISLSAAASLNGHVLALPTRTDCPWPIEPHLLRLRDATAQTDISGLIDALLREQRDARSNAPAAQTMLAGLIAIWLNRQITESPDAVSQSTASDRLIAAFLETLERNFTSGASLSAYAEQLDVSPTHLSRVCKAHLGVSGADLIAQRTLHAARTALETTKDPIQDVSKRFGFGSAAYFSRFIQAHTGHSPRNLRAAAHNTRVSSPA